VDHPFVLKLESTAQDEHCLYMLLEYVQGGELFAYLAASKTGYIPVDHARFYAACVLAGVGALHAQHILYRDLKPGAREAARRRARRAACGGRGAGWEQERAARAAASSPPLVSTPLPPCAENLMIDREGYLKLVDMGFAKAVKDRTYTLCGTPEYLAPELVLGQGHSKGVDLWAIGVLLFELVAGRSPFCDPGGNDQMVICKNIVKGKFAWPAHVRDRDLKDVVSKLLVRAVPSRLGCRKDGIAEVMEHKFFACVSWQALLAKKLPAPWNPPIIDDFDAGRFGRCDDEPPVTPYVDDGSKWAANF
jgi:serine/threonine protein kinase